MTFFDQWGLTRTHLVTGDELNRVLRRRRWWPFYRVVTIRDVNGRGVYQGRNRRWT